MRLVDIKDLKVNVNGEEFAMRELKENENYQAMRFYREKIGDNYYRQYTHCSAGEIKEEVISELDKFEDEKKEEIDDYVYKSNELLIGFSLLSNESFMKGETKLEDFAEVERNKDGKILHYKLKSGSEEMKFDYDERGNLNYVNLDNGEHVLNKVYDAKDRVMEISHYMDDDFILKESITYYENYKETLCDIGCSQNVTREYYDDKKRLLIGVSSDGTEFNPDEISGITVYDYQDNGDIIKESIFTFAVDIFYSL